MRMPLMVSMGSQENARLRRQAEDRMLEWKCRIENPPPIKKSMSLPVSTRTSATLRKSSSRDSLNQVFEKLPKILAFENSSGGAGAPRRSPSGRIQTDLRGHPEIRFHQRDNTVFERGMRYQFDKEAIKKYKFELDKQIAEKINLAERHVETSDLATIMSSREGPMFRRWESLPKLNSTDITRAYVLSSPRTTDTDEYQRDLQSQLDSKRETAEQHSRQEKYLNSLHFNSFNTFWGKPGGGAPKIVKKKENLFKLLNNNR